MLRFEVSDFHLGSVFRDQGENRLKRQVFKIVGKHKQFQASESRGLGNFPFSVLPHYNCSRV